jgi:hypothetical protein
VIVPGCDPPDPSADGCPNASVCWGLPNADGVGFEVWPKADVVIGFCMVPKAEVVVFWGISNTEVGGFAGVLPNTDVVVLAGAPKTDCGLVAPVPPKALVG